MVRLAAVILSYGLVLSACSASHVKSESELYPEQPHELRDTLDAYLRAEAESGFSGTVLVVQDEETVLRKGYAPTGTISPRTAFWIGSMAKPITAAAILKLEEEGRLSTGDRIGRFFDRVPADKQEITIHQLLTHTSGLPSEYAADGITDRNEAVRTILALPLKSKPGTDVSYSNDAFNLLAAIVEIAAERPYEKYIAQEIFGPAGMTNSGFWPGPAEGQTIARVASAPRREIARPNWGFRGSTGIYSTVDDLHAFTRALRAGRIASSATAERALRPQVDRPGNATDIGYGWFMVERAGVPVIMHGGFESGLNHGGVIYIFPTRATTVVLLSNSPEDITRNVRSSVLQVTVPTP